MRGSVVPRRPPSAAAASGPAELVEAVVVDAEVVAHLVDDGDPHLVDHLVLGAADGAGSGRR